MCIPFIPMITDIWTDGIKYTSSEEKSSSVYCATTLVFVCCLVEFQNKFRPADATRLSETLVTTYKTTGYHIPELSRCTIFENLLSILRCTVYP